MSIIFRKAHTVSTTCPCCNSQNELSLGAHNIKWYVWLTRFDYPTNRRGDSRVCSRQYCRIEEVHDVTSVQDIDPGDGDKQPPREPKTEGCHDEVMRKNDRFGWRRSREVHCRAVEAIGKDEDLSLSETHDPESKNWFCILDPSA